MPALAPFAIAGARGPLPDRPSPLTGSGELACRSTGWIADAWREVELWRHAEGLMLRIPGVCECAVTADGVAVLGRATVGVTADTIAEVLLGAPLVLALALQHVWCLHASAVIVDGSAIAFAGESGNGKSTLSAYLDGAGDGGWARLADDTLPIALGSDGVLALPHFPQLKLPPAAQYPVHAQDRLPLAALCVIAPPSPDGSGTVSLRRLGQRHAMQALIRHTVASRLFDRSLLAAHLAFCVRAAAGIPVWQLSYPQRTDILPGVRNAIRGSLGLFHRDDHRAVGPT